MDLTQADISLLADLLTNYQQTLGARRNAENTTGEEVFLLKGMCDRVADLRERLYKLPTRIPNQGGKGLDIKA